MHGSFGVVFDLVAPDDDGVGPRGSWRCIGNAGRDLSV